MKQIYEFCYKSVTNPPATGVGGPSCQKNVGLRSSIRHAAMRYLGGMKIMIVTDAWFPQTNGVVSTLAQTAAWLGRFGHDVRTLDPGDFRSIACPTYPEIRLSLFPYHKVKRSILAF